MRADYDAAVKASATELRAGATDRTVLAALQGQGWTVKQSNHILEAARS